MIRQNFRSSPWAAQALQPGDAPSSPSPSPPREFPSGPIHQKAILCLAEMDIDPNAMQLSRAAKAIAPADFCSWPVTSPRPPVPSVHPVAWTPSWPHTSPASFRLWARLVTTRFPVSFHFWTDLGPIWDRFSFPPNFFAPTASPNAPCHGSRHGLSRVLCKPPVGPIGPAGERV